MKNSLRLIGVLCVALLCLLALVPAGAQQLEVITASPIDAEDQLRAMAGVRYLVALVVGVVLALAFQLLLTNLSLAAGLNLQSFDDDDDDSHAHSRGQTQAHTHTHEQGTPEAARQEAARQEAARKEAGRHDAGKDKRPVSGAVRKTTNAFGLWSLITATLALFFASLLAGTMGFLTTPEAGAVFGLAVWAVFYLLLVRFETHMATSIVGSLFSTTTSALTAATSQTRHLLGVAGHAAGASRGQASGAMRYRLENSEEGIRQRDQVRRMAYRLQSEAGLTPDATKDLLYEFLHDPREGVDDLLTRLQRLDRNRVREILLEHEDITEEEADTILGHYDSARSGLLKNRDQAREGVQRRKEVLRHEVMARADQTRRWVAQMAWWAFGIAVISGAASVLGGTLAALLNTPV